MKLARKFAVVFFVGISAVLAVHSYYWLEYDVSIFEADMLRDHHLIGHTLASALQRAWLTLGEKEALDLLKIENADPSHMRIRWIWLDASPGSPEYPCLSGERLALLEKGIELLLWGQKEGFRWFNLGMAPLSGLEDRMLAPLWSRIGAKVFQHGEHFYNFEGLRQYKEKFRPTLEPRYLAAPRGLTLSRVLGDIAVLIGRGVGGVFRK